jgi:hypothetical protein
MRRLLLSTLGFWLAGLGVAAAQDASEQQRLYEQMVQQPANYGITAAFVEVAVRRADYEAAIGALERLLFYNPNMPLVKYELGVLYYRLRVYDIAKRYFSEAQASPELSAATKAKIEDYLADADTQSQRGRLSGFLQTGLRYQSNASFSPQSGLTRFGGQSFTLPQAAGGTADGNWFALAGLSHDYDLQDDRGDVVLETRVFGSLTQQFRFTNLNVGLVDGSIGPRLKLPDSFLPEASLKPYLAGGNIWVGGGQFLSSKGAGLSGRAASPWGMAIANHLRIQHGRLVHCRARVGLCLQRAIEAGRARLLPARPGRDRLSELRSMGRRSGSVVRICPALPVDLPQFGGHGLRTADRHELRRGESLHRPGRRSCRFRVGRRRYVDRTDHPHLRHIDDCSIRPGQLVASQLWLEQLLDPVRPYRSVLKRLSWNGVINPSSPDC